MSTMFDPDEFRSPQDSGRDLRGDRKRGMSWFQQHRRLSAAVESDGSWVVVANSQGPLDLTHRIDDVNELGSVTTKCNQFGRVLHHPHAGTKVLICKECEEA